MKDGIAGEWWMGNLTCRKELGGLDQIIHLFVFMMGFCSSLYRAFGPGTKEVATPSCGFIHKKTVRAQEFPHDTTAEASPPSDQRALSANTRDNKYQIFIFPHLKKKKSSEATKHGSSSSSDFTKGLFEKKKSVEVCADGTDGDFINSA